MDCDPELGRYFRHLFYIGNHKCRRPQISKWKDHVTIVSCHQSPKYPEFWRKYDGLEIPFLVSSICRTDGVFLWLSVVSGFLTELRMELGLTQQPRAPFHLTIGNLKNE